MFVRLKIGCNPGEIRDIAPEAARAMLKDGRAENAYPELQTPAVPAIAAEAEAQAPVQHRRRKGAHA